jgi:hypothetical protein
MAHYGCRMQNLYDIYNQLSSHDQIQVQQQQQDAQRFQQQQNKEFQQFQHQQQIEQQQQPNSTQYRHAEQHQHLQHQQQEHIAVTTVSGQRMAFTKAEQDAADRALQLNERMGYPAFRTQMRMIRQGDIANSSISPAAVGRAIQIHGPASIAKLKGSSTARNAPPSNMSGPLLRPAQTSQCLIIDIFFVDGVAFLLGVLYPLMLCFVEHLISRSYAHVVAALVSMKNAATSLRLDVRAIECDGEGALQKLRDTRNPPAELSDIIIETTPGAHHGIAEKRIQLVKERHRSTVARLPFVMCLKLLIACILFVVVNTNKERPYSSPLPSPFEQATGHQVSEPIDYRVGFGDYVQSTVTTTDSTAAPRTEGGIALRTVN